MFPWRPLQGSAEEREQRHDRAEQGAMKIGGLNDSATPVREEALSHLFPSPGAPFGLGWVRHWWDRRLNWNAMT